MDHILPLHTNHMLISQYIHQWTCRNTFLVVEGVEGDFTWLYYHHSLNWHVKPLSAVPRKLDPEAAYVHYCANETVNGVEFSYTPDVGSVPLVADMSSNFCSKPIEVSKHAFIYAGIQKNLGPAGMSVGFVRPDFADGSKEMKICPTYCSWKTTGDNGSMYNTPACFTMYVMGEYLKYTKKLGGVAYWAEQSDKKSGLLYGAIDGSNGFYNCPVEKSARSRMNLAVENVFGNPCAPLFRDIKHTNYRIHRILMISYELLESCEKNRLFAIAHRIHVWYIC